jgi:uncharacterized protein YmfQ (DUF2313 family)
MLDSWERAWGLPEPCLARPSIVDERSQGGYQVATNNPELNEITPAAGQYWTAQTFDPGTPEQLIVDLPPYPTGMTINNNDRLQFDGTNWSLLAPPSPTISERQNELVLKMTLLGAQSAQFFIGVAQSLGYPTTVSEYRPFMVGVDRCGDNRVTNPDGSLGPWPCQIGHPRMRFAWTMHVQHTHLVWFRASKGQCGIDPLLRIVFAEDLECMIRRWKPAHTQVLFDYSGVTSPDNIYAGTGAPLEVYCNSNPYDVVCARPPYL